MQSTRLKPLRITWRLASPMVAARLPLHLDALIGYAVAEEAMRSGLTDSAQIDERVRALPLALELRGDSACWQASAVMPVPGQAPLNSMRSWTRKTDPYDYTRRIEGRQLDIRATRGPATKPIELQPFALKIDMQRGPMKQMFKHFPVRFVQEVQAYCVGDEDRIVELLDPQAGYITALGAKRRMGFGRIIGFDIQHDTAAKELWQSRVLPWPHDGAIPVVAATQGAYWDAANSTHAYLHPSVMG